MSICWVCAAEVDADHRSETERKLPSEPDASCQPQPVSTYTSTPGSCNMTVATTTATPTAATTDATFVNIFDDFDWDLDSAESLQSLSDEELKKRHSVMIEKV